MPATATGSGTMRRVPLLAVSTGLLAQSSGGPYTLRREVVAGGGHRAAAGTYVATVTAAQPGAHLQSGGGYRLTGGFHGPQGNPGRIFCDGFEGMSCP
jgi:hypothetical protein